MRICRFDDDRLGIVANGLVHNVTAARIVIDWCNRHRQPWCASPSAGET
jgi:hypothetical protein